MLKCCRIFADVLMGDERNFVVTFLALCTTTIYQYYIGTLFCFEINVTYVRANGNDG